jgi:hypothetical protein
LHTKAQWDAIHGDLAKIFIIDPPLRPLTMERYLQKHLSSVRQKWRKIWNVGGDTTRPNTYLMHAWKNLVKYRKTPHAKHESEWMQEIHLMVSNPWKLGCMSITRRMSLEVECIIM